MMALCQLFSHKFNNQCWRHPIWNNPQWRHQSLKKTTPLLPPQQNKRRLLPQKQQCQKKRPPKMIRTNSQKFFSTRISKRRRSQHIRDSLSKFSRLEPLTLQLMNLSAMVEDRIFTSFIKKKKHRLFLMKLVKIL